MSRRSSGSEARLGDAAVATVLAITPLRLDPLARVERVPEAVAEEARREDDQDQRDARVVDPDWVAEEVLLRIGQHVPEARLGRSQAEAQERQGRLRDDGVGDPEGRGDDDRRERARDHVPDDDPAVAGAEGLRRLDELRLAE